MPETLCYPRPLQEHVPILVGGSGEKRTLQLAGRYADACNIFGDPTDRGPQGGGAGGPLREAGRHPRRSR